MRNGMGVGIPTTMTEKGVSPITFNHIEIRTILNAGNIFSIQRNNESKSKIIKSF